MGWAMRKGYYYLAAPYSTGFPLGVDPKEYMLQRAMEINQIAARLMQHGLVVFSPITHGHALESLLPISTAKSHSFWMEQCRPLVDGAQGVIVAMLPGWHESTGVRMETEWANEGGIKINHLMPGCEQQMAMDLLAK